MHVCMKKSMKLFDHTEAIDISKVLNPQEVNLRNFMQLT